MVRKHEPSIFYVPRTKPSQHFWTFLRTTTFWNMTVHTTHPHAHSRIHEFWLSCTHTNDISMCSLYTHIHMYRAHTRAHTLNLGHYNCLSLAPLAVWRNVFNMTQGPGFDSRFAILKTTEKVRIFLCKILIKIQSMASILPFAATGYCFGVELIRCSP